MSVWPGLANAPATLETSEGTLVSISVHVEPLYLEVLLDTLAGLDFPINPEIYHDGSVTHVYADGREQTEPVTIVEFPAYRNLVAEVKRALAEEGFAGDALHVAEMLDEIRQGMVVEPAPPGAGYERRVYRKWTAVAA